jgi:hypothetical protein
VRSFLFFDKTKHLQDLQAACIKTARRKMGKLRGCHTILVRQPHFYHRANKYAPLVARRFV